MGALDPGIAVVSGRISWNAASSGLVFLTMNTGLRRVAAAEFEKGKLVRKKSMISRLRREDGAALVEFSLVLPIIVILMVGSVSTGFALNRTNSLNNAAREGARFGATLPADNMVQWLNSVADVAEDSATGDLDDGVDGRTICVAYVYPSGAAPVFSDDDDISVVIATDHTARLIVNQAGNKTYSIGKTCYSDGRPNGERRVQVAVERNVDLNFVFSEPTVEIDGRSTSRFERVE